jgi:probable F420-dependent oxidoreductase
MPEDTVVTEAAVAPPAAPVAPVPVMRPTTITAAEPAPDATGPGLRVETLLLGPSLEQYSGSSAGIAEIGPIAEAARLIEELGFDGVTTPEAGHDAFLPLMIAAEHTSKIALGTNVAIAFPRSPMATAQVAWDLQRFSGGRFSIGLGTQVKGHNERRYAAPWLGPPGPRLRDYLLCMKAMFHTFQTGEPPSYEGEYYRFTLMSPFFSPGKIDHPDIPIYIAALNPYMARLSGELCEGVRMHPLATYEYTRDVILPQIEKGAKKGGRQRSDVDLVGSPFLVSGKNNAEVEAAKAGVKQQLAFYSSTRTYHGVLEHHGWGEVGRKLHQLTLEGKWQDMQNEITDEMLEAFAIVGTYDELVPKLKERWGEICDTIFLGFPPELLAEKALVRDIVEELHKP